MPTKQQIQHMLESMNVKDLRRLSKYFEISVTKQIGGYKNKNELVGDLVGGSESKWTVERGLLDSEFIKFKEFKSYNLEKLFEIATEKQWNSHKIRRLQKWKLLQELEDGEEVEFARHFKLPFTTRAAEELTWNDNNKRDRFQKWTRLHYLQREDEAEFAHHIDLGYDARRAAQIKWDDIKDQRLEIWQKDNNAMVKKARVKRAIMNPRNPFINQRMIKKTDFPILRRNNLQNATRALQLAFLEIRDNLIEIRDNLTTYIQSIEMSVRAYQSKQSWPNNVSAFITKHVLDSDALNVARGVKIGSSAELFSGGTILEIARKIEIILKNETYKAYVASTLENITIDDLDLSKNLFLVIMYAFLKLIPRGSDTSDLHQEDFLITILYADKQSNVLLTIHNYYAEEREGQKGEALVTNPNKAGATTRTTLPQIETALMEMWFSTTNTALHKQRTHILMSNYINNFTFYLTNAIQKYHNHLARANNYANPTGPHGW